MFFATIVVLCVLFGNGLASIPVHGTILGEDGRAVSAQLGFDIQDSSGRAISATGCLIGTPGCAAPGYGITIRVNTYLDATGSTNTHAYATTWSTVLPSNAAYVYLEAYPKGYGPYSATNETRYGHSYRRKMLVFYMALGAINVRLPLVCAAGGHTGSIQGVTYVNGVPVQYSRVATWSIAPDNNTPSPILGFTVGTTLKGGGYILPNLPSGQLYQILATPVGGATVHVFTTQNVPACGVLPVNIRATVAHALSNDSMSAAPDGSGSFPAWGVVLIVLGAVLVAVALIAVVAMVLRFRQQQLADSQTANAYVVM